MKKVRSKLYPTKIGVIKTFNLSPDDEIGEIAVECTGCTFYYNNLAELCEKWEDYEGPKIINELDVVLDALGEYCNEHSYYSGDLEKIKILNIVEDKLKAWKRLKGHGLRVERGQRIFVNADDKLTSQKPLFVVDTYEEVEKDLDLLFGGKE